MTTSPKKKIPIDPERTRENLTRVQELLSTLKKDARDAQDAKDLYMVSVYEEILAVIAPIVTRCSNRLDREELAEFRKSRRSLKQELEAALATGDDQTPA